MLICLFVYVSEIGNKSAADCEWLWCRRISCDRAKDHRFDLFLLKVISSLIDAQSGKKICVCVYICFQYIYIFFSLCFPGPLIHSSQNCPGGHGFHSPFFYSGHGCQEEINLLQPNEIWASQHWPLMKNALMASIRKLVLSVPEGTFK